jgi:mannose-1-phosphate guanylyltransferase
MSFYALIMAGGGGTRLWPLSRQARPKQALKLVGDRTMFQHAVDRVRPIFPPDRILVVTGPDHVAELRDQASDLPSEGFIVEPMGRGTAPAIGLGAIHIQKRDPRAVMAVLTADHYIRDVERFRRALSAAATVAQAGHLVTLGIKPTFASTGYGYIEQGDPLDTVDGFSVFRAARFTEKPDAKAAAQMIESGHFAWNSGMFIWRADRIMAEFARQMPDFHTQLLQVEAALSTPEYGSTLARVWPQVERQTIDYGVMEGADDVAVLPVDIGWSDVGSWSSMEELRDADAHGNVVVGDCLRIDTENTIVFSEGRLVATIGVKDLIVVETDEAVLVCPREREQEVRRVVRRLREMGREDLL